MIAVIKCSQNHFSIQDCIYLILSWPDLILFWKMLNRLVFIDLIWLSPLIINLFLIKSVYLIWCRYYSDVRSWISISKCNEIVVMYFFVIITWKDKEFHNHQSCIYPDDIIQHFRSKVFWMHTQVFWNNSILENPLLYSSAVWPGNTMFNVIGIASNST